MAHYKEDPKTGGMVKDDKKDPRPAHGPRDLADGDTFHVHKREKDGKTVRERVVDRYIDPGSGALIVRCQIEEV